MGEEMDAVQQYREWRAEMLCGVGISPNVINTIHDADAAIEELQAEIADLRGENAALTDAHDDLKYGVVPELQAENERLFVALKGKHVRERLYQALKDIDEMAKQEREDW